MKKAAKYTLVSLLFILVVILFLGGGLGSKNPISINNGRATLFAHRGATEFAVENSFKAFEQAKELGFNTIETDVNCTKDGKLILFHDESCKRLLNLEADISTLNWSDVKELYLHQHGKKTKQHILSLEHFFEYMDDSMLVYLDIKVSSFIMADRLLHLIDKYNCSKNVIIADEQLLFLAYLKFQEPAIKVSLEGFDKGKEILYYIIPKHFKPDFYSSFLDNIDREHMLFLAKNNLLNSRIVYGINNENISKALELGLHNIIFDYRLTQGSIGDLKGLLTKNKYR